MTAELEWLYTTCTSKDKILLAAMISHSSKLRAWKSLNMRGWKTLKGNLNAKLQTKIMLLLNLKCRTTLIKKKLS